MPSPDFSQYIDLTINDKQPDEIYDEAVDYARLALPEFAPRPGTVEDAILQATAYISALNLGNLNRLPDGIMEGVLRYMGVLRKEATFSSVLIEFELDQAGGTVPSGTIAYYETTDGDVLVQYPFITSADVSAAPGETTVLTNATCQVAGIVPNIPSGTALILAQPSTTVLSATTNSAINQGARAESEVEYFNRGTSKLESISSVLTTARQVENYILAEYPEVHRCKVYDLTKAVFYDAADLEENGNKALYAATVHASEDFITAANEVDSDLFLVYTPDFYGDSSYEDLMPTGAYFGASAGSASITYSDNVSSNGDFGPISVLSLNSVETGQQGDSPGYFVIFMCDSSGNPVYSKTKDDIFDDVSSRIVAGLSFNILDAYPVDLNFTVTISVDPSFGASQVANNVAQELESYLSLPNWPNWDTVVRIFDIVVRASRVAGVSYVYSVSGSVPSYNGETVRANNEYLVSELNEGGNLVGYSILHLGVMPRANVEVVVV